MSTTTVWEITSLKLEISKSLPPILTINAEGRVRTGGYSKARLEPRIYVHPPADGIYEFDFVATPPPGMATQVISPIKAEPYHWEDYPKDLKGVKVYAEENSMVEHLPA